MIAMIAVYEVEPGRAPCVIRWTGRQGLSVNVLTYCNDKHSAGDGVLQVPASSTVCSRCEAAIKRIAATIP